MIVGAAALCLAAGAAARAAHRAPAKAEAAQAAPAPEARLPERSAEAPFHGLLAVGEAEARTRLGPPDLARVEGSGAMWTYRLPDCALFVFFKKSGADGLRVSGAASGPRVRGRNPPPVNECLSEAFDRRQAEGEKSGK